MCLVSVLNDRFVVSYRDKELDSRKCLKILLSYAFVWVLLSLFSFVTLKTRIKTKKIINNSNNIQRSKKHSERWREEKVMFLEILTQSANTKGVKSKSFRYWNQKINSQATQNNHYKTSKLSVPFGYKLWKMVVKKTYKYRGKQKKTNTFWTSRKAKTNCAQKLTLE